MSTSGSTTVSRSEAPRRFGRSQDGKTYHGTVINLTGAAGAPANFAIAPINLRKSPFYVTIAMDDMGEAGCSIGRTGTVTFGNEDTASARAGQRRESPASEGLHLRKLKPCWPLLTSLSWRLLGPGWRR